MKKTRKKLVLSKETVLNLSVSRLRSVAAGVTTTTLDSVYTVALGCDPSATCVDTQLCNSNEIACIDP